MHDLPLSPEDRSRVLVAARNQAPRERLLAEIVFGHGWSLSDALALRAEDMAWGDAHVRLTVHADTRARRSVTVERQHVGAVLGSRRRGPVFATASGVPIRSDYAARALARLAEVAGVPGGLSVRRLRLKRSAAPR